MMAKERLRATVAVVPEFPGLELLSIARYSTDGYPDEVDDVDVYRDHPEVPCTAHQRNTALRERGWNAVGGWTRDEEGNSDYVTVVRRTEPEAQGTG